MEILLLLDKTRIVLNTQSFSLEGINLLQNALLSKIKLRTRLIEKEKDKWLIVIPYRQIIKLHSIVGHHMHETKLYKVKKKIKQF